VRGKVRSNPEHPEDPIIAGTLVERRQRLDHETTRAKILFLEARRRLFLTRIDLRQMPAALMRHIVVRMMR